MINIKEKKNCCGCGACVQKCSMQSISLKEDNEGFLYPFVNYETCIDCGICEKVCPVINKNESRGPLNVYAAINPNEEERMKSSSGGIFSMLADFVLREGGVVFGARFDNNWNVLHDFSETKEGIKKFRGSKYIQSRIGETYIQTRDFLKEGRMVLYSGTPCQIAGLKSFLGKEYDNLLTIDIICHGVPSYKVFLKYLREDVISKYKFYNIKSVNFRDKIFGWKKYSLRFELGNDSQKIKSIKSHLLKNPFLRGFRNNVYLRPSCYECPFKKNNSGSDMTLGDLWGICDMNIGLKDDDKGISVVLTNTKKSLRIFDQQNATATIIDYNKVVHHNPALISSALMSDFRESFFSNIDAPFDTLINKYFPISFKQHVFMVIRDIVSYFFYNF